MTGNLRVLVVDDDRISRRATLRQLQDAGYLADAVENAFQALERLEAQSWDVVVTDLRMPMMDGVALLREIKKKYPSTDVILMTAYGTVETAVAAMQEGAADYLEKPFPVHELDLRLKKLWELREAHAEVNALKAILDEEQSCFGLVVGRSPVMRSACDSIGIFAKHDAPVLITGETGTGKELVARALHREGPRARGPFIPVACGTIPRELAESELFGHEKGSFTGATQRRRGSFERADTGTLLLDDVDDLPLEIQVKLLRVLQEGTFRRVGGSEEITVDVRVVATSKLPLDAAAKSGRFRDDLFYRLRGLEIHLPPLRERGDDVLLLAEHFLRILAAREAGPVKTLSLEAAACLRRYRWPGNVRELRRAMESASVLCRNSEIRPEHLPEYLRDENGGFEGRLFSLHLGPNNAVHFNDVVEDFESALIQWALRRAGGQQTHAAEILGIPRTTLQSKLVHHREEKPEN